jgi:hypothetical protein
MDSMVETIELNSLNLRFERTRRRDAALERRLLSSIMERDIEQPLQISICKDTRQCVLLDGFKRYRCARKLHLNIIPVCTIGEDVADGVLCLLRRESESRLSILEQAGMIEELHKKHGLSIYAIAERLERSPSWVNVRLGMIGEISELVRGKIMSGAFPARAYMYGVRVYTRVHKAAPAQVDAFVGAVSGKGLSTRELGALSRAYFTGGSSAVRMIVEGDAHQAVKLLAAAQCGAVTDPALTPDQQLFVNNLKTIANAMVRIIAAASSAKAGAGHYKQYINTWSASIGKSLPAFSQTIKELHDLSGPADHGAHALQSGSGPQGNSAVGTD